MKILLAEDDFVTRKFMANFLSKYGDCDVEPTNHEVVEIAKRIIDLPNNDELMLTRENEESAREILARYRKAAVI